MFGNSSAATGGQINRTGEFDMWTGRPGGIEVKVSAG